jgi:hypothetical protein
MSESSRNLREPSKRACISDLEKRLSGVVWIRGVGEMSDLVKLDKVVPLTQRLSIFVTIPLCLCNRESVVDGKVPKPTVPSSSLHSPHFTDSPMNATLRDRLIQAEQQFLIAVVANDEAALKDFSQEWSWLARNFKAIEARGELDDSTTLLLSHVSRVIKATANCMLECEAILNEGQICSTNDPALNLLLDNTLSVSTNPSSFPSYRLLFSSASTSGTFGILGQKKLLDAHAYRWLMQNMHNPYPTATQIQTISDESLTSMAQAELWFQEVRDTIGWTRLSNEFYGGSLDATTAAARRVYLENDNTIPFDVAFTFAAVKSSMEALFLEYPASLAENVGDAQTLQSVHPGQDQRLKESTADSDCMYKITTQHISTTSRILKKRIPRHHLLLLAAKGISLKI